MKVAWLSFALMIIGTLLAAAAILSGKATVLYTFYPPLRAHPAFYIGVVLLVVGSWVAFFNWLPPYFAWKREHPDKKVPLAVVGIFATFIIWLIATTPVAIEVIFLLIPWSMGWVATVNVPLARMLFWFFGHPLVYFWLVPAYVMYYTMLPKLAGGKLFSDFAGRLTFLWLVLYSAPVGIHHQFTEPGISSTWKFVHAFFTMLVAVPSFLTAFTMAPHWNTVRARAGWPRLDGMVDQTSVCRQRPLAVFLFVCGIGHFHFWRGDRGNQRVLQPRYRRAQHLLVARAFPSNHRRSGVSCLHRHEFVSGRNAHRKEIRLPTWNVWMPYIWTLGIMIFSTGLFIGGAGGEPRRTNMGLSYTDPQSHLYHPDWRLPKMLGSIGGTIMTIAALMFFVVFFATLFGKRINKAAWS